MVMMEPNEFSMTFVICVTCVIGITLESLFGRSLHEVISWIAEGFIRIGLLRRRLYISLSGRHITEYGS